MSYIYTSLEFMSASMFEKTVVGKGALTAATEEPLNTPFITAFHRHLSTNTSFQHLGQTSHKEVTRRVGGASIT